MAEYIDREAALALAESEEYLTQDGDEIYHEYIPVSAVKSIPASDVLPRDEAIKMGAELAAMHGSDATSQQLEEAYLKGVEYGMTRRDVRSVVVCADCEHNNHCLTQEFVDDCGKIPLDRNSFFCADGERKSNA